jgi:hypothetical protein
MPIDPTAAMVVGGAATLALQGASEFVKKIGGKMGDDVGEWFSQIATYRFRNMAETIRRANEQLAAAGAEAHEVPPRVLIPLLEHASIDDDEDMRERWAALLAHAAIATDPDEVPPVFADILSQITPAAAVVLEALAEKTRPRTGQGVPFSDPLAETGGLDISNVRWIVARRRGDDRGSRAWSPEEDRAARALVDLLVRQGLATESVALRQVIDTGRRSGSETTVSANGIEVRVTELGRQFLRACRPPGRVAEVESTEA